ncbi:hypothetical protein HRbin19_00095 [bacterium HR19]|nr:hypothetical protein HRbin19_00095 [bacterium HR19]
MSKKKIARLDPVFKEIFQKSIPEIIKLVSNQKPQKISLLPEELRFVKQLRADLLLSIKTKNRSHILHFEIQNQSDKLLPEKMLLYKIAIKAKYKKEPEQFVLWFGKGNPPKPQFKDKSTLHRFKVIDMRKLGLRRFLESHNPYFVILGIVSAREKRDLELIKERIKVLSRDEEERKEVMKNLILLSDMLKIKLSREMIPKVEIPVEKTTLYKIGFEEGEKSGRLKGKVEGLKEAILLDFELKFGNGQFRKSKLNELKKLLSKIDDIRKLRKIKKAIFSAENPDEFLKKIKSFKAK